MSEDAPHGSDSLRDPDAPTLPGIPAQTVRVSVETVRLPIDPGQRQPPPQPRARLEDVGSQVGPYRLVEMIGEGGFGRVYAAEQERPVRRKVAFKVIKLGMDTADVVGRFEQERQALAWMDHPNIAKVLDAGSTDSGRPYFVMEYCPGESITNFCDRNRLPLRARLGLFVAVCQAIQHAHQRGLIHRDIKPGNILVSLRDGQPVAKVIDFGIAKAVAAPAGADTFVTRYQHLIGTPEYMSPEQAQGSADIDTRTDVYSLGIVLYELIAGDSPLGAAISGCNGYADLIRVIRDVEAPPPSSFLSRSAETLAKVAATRQCEPKKLLAASRGELDWIVMKAIEKDRGRRYETANGLARDVERYLSGEDVVAVPPSAGYKLRKFVLRHKGAVAAGTAIAAALLAGLAGTVWQARIAATQRDLARREAVRADERAAVAQKAEAEQRRLAAAEALQRAEAVRQKAAAEASARAETARAAELRAVADFQARMLGRIDPAEAGAALLADLRQRFSSALVKNGVASPAVAARAAQFESDLLLTSSTDAAVAVIERNVLEPAVAAINQQFRDQPAVDASLRQSVAVLLRNLGRYEQALPLQQQALATRRRVLGPDHPDTLASLDNMGRQLQVQGKLAEADPFLTEALDRRRRVLGATHPDTLASVSNLGFLRLAQARLPDAEREFRLALALRTRVLGADHPDTLESMNNLSVLLRQQDRYKEAESLLRQTVAKRRRVLGQEHPETLVSIGYLGALLRKVRDFDGAEPLLREALEKRRRVLGETHPETLASMNNLGQLLRQMERYQDAEPLLRSALDGRRRTLGEDHVSTLVSRIDMGQLLRKLKRHGEAEALFRQSVEGYQKQLGRDNWRTADARVHLSNALTDLRRFEPAESELLEAERVLNKTLGAGNTRHIESLESLMKFYKKWHTAAPASGHDQRSSQWKLAWEKAKAVAVPAEAETEQ